MLVYNRPIRISSKDVCVISDSQSERLPNTKDLGFSSLLNYLFWQTVRPPLPPSSDYSQ